MIKLFDKNVSRQIEVYNKVVNVLKHATPSKTILCKWALEFKRGRMSNKDILRSGRLKIVTMTDIIKKMLYTVLEYRRLRMDGITMDGIIF